MTTNNLYLHDIVILIGEYLNRESLCYLSSACKNCRSVDKYIVGKYSLDYTKIKNNFPKKFVNFVKNIKNVDDEDYIKKFFNINGLYFIKGYTPDFEKFRKISLKNLMIKSNNINFEIKYLSNTIEKLVLDIKNDSNGYDYNIDLRYLNNLKILAVAFHPGTKKDIILPDNLKELRLNSEYYNIPYVPKKLEKVFICNSNGEDILHKLPNSCKKITFAQRALLNPVMMFNPYPINFSNLSHIPEHVEEVEYYLPYPILESDIDKIREVII